MYWRDVLLVRSTEKQNRNEYIKNVRKRIVVCLKKKIRLKLIYERFGISEKELFKIRKEEGCL